MTDMANRRRRFRNAVIEVALQDPGVATSGAAVPPSVMPNEPEVRPPTVLIVDDSHHARNLHRALILSCSPNADITTCASLDESISFLQQCDANDKQINLVLLDLNLTRQ